MKGRKKGGQTMAAKRNRKRTPQICIVTVTGRDRVGIIARIANVMADANVNIIDVSQRIMADCFVMMMGCDVSGSRVEMAEMQRRLDRVAKEMSLNITFQNETIFKMMHRI